ncbi:MAG: hypothetical protein U1F76_30535 [Candidatus Competibacteraceae bacterium]
MDKSLLPGFAMVLLFAGLENAGAADTERGKLLYENHCTSCHESVAHVRENRRARALAEIYWQTTRWAVTERLEWRYEDVNDVTQYLNNEFYKFPERLECR